MVDSLDRPEKAQYHLVRFTGEDPSLPLALTNWDTAIDPTSTNFISHPAMELEIPPNVGGFGEGLFKITMKIDAVTQAMLDPMSRGTVFAPTFVVAQEVIEPTRIGDSGNTRTIFRGQVYRTRRNAKSKSGLVIVECKNDKALLDVQLGFQVNAQCVWRLNGVGCNEPGGQFPFGYNTLTFPIASIDGKKITVADPGLAMALANTRSWTRGFIKKNGAFVGIQHYDKAVQDPLAVKEFTLIKQPPVEWLTGTVEFHPGCTKNVSGDGGCDDTGWDNIEGFGGSGIGIPAYNPITENPQ